MGTQARCCVLNANNAPSQKVICGLLALPQVLKDVSGGSESPPRSSHAGPYQLCALLFCQSADGNNRANYTPVRSAWNGVQFDRLVLWFDPSNQSVIQYGNETLGPHL